MPIYKYIVNDKDGRISEHIVVAKDGSRVKDNVEASGLRLLKVTEMELGQRIAEKGPPAEPGASEPVDFL